MSKTMATMYFEKREGIEFSNCRIEIEAGSGTANVWFDDDPNYKYFPFGADSERMAVKYVERLGYVPAEEWKLPPDLRQAPA
jgi:hypothetical protein